MFLTNIDDKWAQDKINTAYGMLENCIATTKQRETVQPYYNIHYVGDLSDLSVQCPRPIRAETLWATSLCDNTVIPVGNICINGNLLINSSCLKTHVQTAYTFCEESRFMSMSGISTCEDHFIVNDCPTLATYENCIWNGSSRQYNCRMKMSRLCQDVWQKNIMDYSIMKVACCCQADIEYADECLCVCNECAGCWELPYPCFVCCTFCNVCMKQIDSQFLIYCTPDGFSYLDCNKKNNGYFAGIGASQCPYCCYKCMVSKNPGTQNCNFICNLTIPFCYIGWNEHPYCFGGEEKCCFWRACETCWNIIVPCNPLAVVCRVIDVYTVCGANEYNTNPIYVINQNILCGR